MGDPIPSASGRMLGCAGLVTALRYPSLWWGPLSQGFCRQMFVHLAVLVIMELVTSGTSWAVGTGLHPDWPGITHRWENKSFLSPLFSLGQPQHKPGSLGASVLVTLTVFKSCVSLLVFLGRR